jgi:DNA polymerase I
MKLFIFDVSNIFYRAFWGSDPLTTSGGIPVQGLHGFIRTVNGIMRDHHPDLVAFAMEGGGISPRKTLEPLYKANRQEPPDELKAQLNMLPELLSVMGYPTFKFENYEADDTIASLTTKAIEQGLQPVIVSSDKDFCSLVHDGTLMFNISKNEMVDESGVFLRYGITAEQFQDYLAIVGDSSDNIQGVKGIGPKGAVSLLSEYGTLDNIYKNVSFIKGANQKKLMASQSDVYKAKKLVEFIKVNFESDLTTSCNWPGPKKEELRTFLRKLEFRELEQMLLGADVINVSGVDIGVRR